MIVESFLPVILATFLGWGGFTWRRSEQAYQAAGKAADMVDKLEIKLAERYVTKIELKDNLQTITDELARMREDMNKYFELAREQNRETLDQIKRAINRLEDKVDYHVTDQVNRK